ncbi:hypothetical protein RQP46_009857 [Phenoliferia psychrophenolica]
MSTNTSKTYTGPQKLVLCIDVGTTQTGCSIVRYDPGVEPTIRVINRYPGDTASSKIPTRMFYDKNGTPRAYGSEVFNEVIVAQAEEEGWQLAAFWKLHLHPEGLNPPSYTSYASSEAPTEDFELVSSNSKFDISPLPKNVSLGTIYRDWFKWLVKAAQKFYEETSADGELLWKKLSGKMEFVVAHPNGYGLAEQTILRKALEDASLIKADDEVGEQRLRFVTEAECSVYFGLEHSPHDWLKIGSQLAVVDLGGSTVDITVYSVDQVEPKLILREAKMSACIQAGGIFVTQAGRQLIQAKLRNSRFLEDLDAIVSEFDFKTKCNFDNAEQKSIIKFGLARDNDSAVNISRGRLTLAGAEVEQAFSGCLESIIESLDEQLAGTTVKNVLTVGGFSESPYLQSKLRETYTGRGLKIIHVDEHPCKAGAVIEANKVFEYKYRPVFRQPQKVYNLEMVLYASSEDTVDGQFMADTDTLLLACFRPVCTLRATLKNFGGTSLEAYIEWGGNASGAKKKAPPAIAILLDGSAADLVREALRAGQAGITRLERELIDSRANEKTLNSRIDALERQLVIVAETAERERLAAIAARLDLDGAYIRIDRLEKAKAKAS